MDDVKYKVSVITVVYNSVDTIEQTIQSVLNQTYKNIEYIIIDGLSTDGTQKIIEQYLDCIAYFISEKDNGIYDAMNKGIRKASGDIIGIINSDDWYAEDAVENIVDCFKQNDVGLVYGNIIDVFQNGEQKERLKEPLENMWHQMSVPHPSTFIKRGIYEKFGVFNTKYALSSDYDFLLNLYSKQVKFGYIDMAISYFRIGGTSTIKDKEMIEETYAISMAHVGDSPNKKEIISKIEERYQWWSFRRKIKLEEENLFELLCQYFHREIKQVAIFGTGLWGEKCCQALLSRGIEIVCFADNNNLKWDTQFCGIKVINPVELQGQSDYVLIAVKESGKKIKHQLESMGNHQLKCASIMELAAVSCKLPS